MPESRIWHTELNPPPLHGNFSVYGLSALTQDVWAVGSSGGSPLIAHASLGEDWQIVSYVSDQAFTGLNAVHAVASDDVWAVGADYNPVATSSGIHIAHFDGSTWKHDPIGPLFRGPFSIFGAGVLNGVSASSRDDVWAVGGNTWTFFGPSAVLGGTGLSSVFPIILHFDGTSWASWPTGTALGWLSDVCATGRGAFCSVGAQVAASHSEALILHGENGAMTNPGRVLAVPGILNGVAASGADDIWAVGQRLDASASTVALILHYDGLSWTEAMTPTIAGGVLNGVACAAADDVWAVGYAFQGGHDRALILHYDGDVWETVEPPATGSGIAVLKAVVTLPNGDAWAAGTVYPERGVSGFSVPLVMAYR